MWQRLHDFFDPDTLRVVGAASIGSGMSLTNIDLVIKILIGLATLAYVSRKAIDIWHPSLSPQRGEGRGEGCDKPETRNQKPEATP